MQVYKLLSNAILDMLTSQNFTGLSILTSKIDPEQFRSAAPEMNISSVPDIVSGSQHFVPVTRNSCRSTVYGILLNFENLPVIVTDRKRILSVIHEIVPGDHDRRLFHALQCECGELGKLAKIFRNYDLPSQYECGSLGKFSISLID